MQAQLEIIRWIQSFSCDFLDKFFDMITFLGSETFLVAIIAYFYWIKDKRIGEYLIFSLSVSLCLNNTIKCLAAMPRPIGQEGILSKRVETATGFSFPSGHSQTAATFFTSLFFQFRKKWLAITGSILMLLVGLSRLYFGVHYPQDVLVGLLLGIAVAVLCWFILQKLRYSKVIYVTSALAFLPFVFVFASNSLAADFYKSYGLLVGFVLGYCLEKQFVNFEYPRSRKQKAFRIIIGLLGAICVKSLLGFVLPKENLWICLSYAMVTFFTVGIYPFIFTKFRF